MADNVPITAGSGTTIATDDVAGVHYQRVKLVDGTLDGTGAIGGDATNGLDVDVTRVQGTVAAAGSVAHDGADSGNPVKVGMRAVAHGSSPTAVAADDRTDWFANRHGVPFTIGGHPNVVTHRANYTAAQTDTVVGPTIGSGSKMVVTQVQVLADNANTVAPSVIIGFGATNTPTGNDVVLCHPGLPGGGGVSRGSGDGILGVGGDGAELRITSGVPTGGSLDVLVSYFLIES